MLTELIAVLEVSTRKAVDNVFPWKQKSIIWTNDDLVYLRLYASSVEYIPLKSLEISWYAMLMITINVALTHWVFPLTQFVKHPHKNTFVTKWCVFVNRWLHQQLLFCYANKWSGMCGHTANNTPMVKPEVSNQETSSTCIQYPGTPITNRDHPDSKVRGANIGPTWVLSAPDGPYVSPMNLAIRATTLGQGWVTTVLYKMKLFIQSLIFRRCFN